MATLKIYEWNGTKIIGVLHQSLTTSIKMCGACVFSHARESGGCPCRPDNSYINPPIPTCRSIAESNRGIYVEATDENVALAVSQILEGDL